MGLTPRGGLQGTFNVLLQGELISYTRLGMLEVIATVCPVAKCRGRRFMFCVIVWS